MHEQYDHSIAAWKALHPNAMPPTPSHTNDEEDGDDDGCDEEDEVAPTNGDE